MFSLDDLQSEYIGETIKRVDGSHGDITSKEFIDCVFKACTFKETAFKACRFIHCRLEHCDLSLATVKNCRFTDTTFEASTLIGVDWTRASWPRTKLACPLGFSRCALSHATFIGMTLRGITLRECVARNVDFREADLTEADLRQTDFTDSLFSKTNLTQADFTGARNYQINAALNTLHGAKFAMPEAMALLYGLDITLVDGDIEA